MTLGIAAWTVFCIGMAMVGSQDDKEHVRLGSVLRAFGLVAQLWACAVGVWIVVELIW